MSLWSSETGILIQEETLTPPVSTRLFVSKFKIEHNHLVLLTVGADVNYILIYEMDKVLAGEDTKPREFALERVEHPSHPAFSKLLVDKTSVTVATDLGAMVELDFWRC